MERVRHYTRVSSMEKILNDLRLIARDQNKVFVEKASQRRLSPSDAVRKYRLKQGKGNAYIEFDIEDDLLLQQYNTAFKLNEYFILGDVDLTDRNPQPFFNW